MSLHELFEHLGESDHRQTHSTPIRGRSVGDGIATSAKIAGAVTLGTVAIQALPILLAGLAGLALFFRGCGSNSASPPNVPMQSQLSAPQTTNWSTPVEPPVSQIAPPRALEPPVQMAAPVPRRVPRSSLAPQHQQDPTFLPLPTFPSDTTVPQFFAPPNMGSNPLPGFLTGSYHENVPLPQGIVVFEAVPGREFVGTSQMSGEASVRIRLNILEVRDGGSSVTVSLSKMHDRRFTRRYEGTIQNGSLRLTPLEERTPMDHGLRTPWKPWHSNSPTPITLAIGPHGKTLTGSSMSGEQFTLMPSDDSPANDDDAPTVSPEWQQFLAETGATVFFRITRHNGKNLEESASWSFVPESPHNGRFHWQNGDRTVCEGRYAKSSQEGHLDLNVLQEPSQRRRIYRTLVAFDAPSVLICVAGPGKPRPSDIHRSFGKTFQLQPEAADHVSR